MKKTVLILMFCWYGHAFGQAANEDLAVIQTVFGKEKKAVVEQYMQLDNSQATAFWQLYGAYESNRRELSRERLVILNDYAKAYDQLDDKTATSLAERTITNDMAYDKFHKRYFKKFSKIIGGKNAAKFFQLELYFQNAIRSSILDEIPFIDELEKSKKSTRS
ncbi:hypothetical protein [Chitinophaga arvensicola]|uniref:Uncharacterized protein n=1 Tax=Chitinophaga arvensicola TaxID=29529 RepID=A0A1I0RQT0_9BACT|nr:hypothetical protein [Chitinophaga arvensicola]SEW43550.1 hypothetical protein SAMN04488122_3233 [Chitinophaga arvensicola]